MPTTYFTTSVLNGHASPGTGNCFPEILTKSFDLDLPTPIYYFFFLYPELLQRTRKWFYTNSRPSLLAATIRVRRA